MCGIQFLLSKINNESIQSKFKKLFNNIRNRGPEDTELIKKVIKNVLFMIGFQRLKINDTSDNGNQPFIFENDTDLIYFMANGEIYNHKQLEIKENIKTTSKSDCEIILRMYQKYCNSSNQKTVEMCVRSIKGVFAGIILHINKKLLTYDMFAFRDRYGVRPLYYGTTETSIALSSELKGLVGLVDNIKQFTPGTILHYSNNKMSFINFYDNYHPIKITNEKIALDGIRNKFENAVVKRMMSDRPMCCLLSGGLDSSLVASVLAKNSKEKIHTFCIGMKGGEDFKYAKMVAEHIGSIHHEIVLSQKDFLDALPEVIRVIETYDGTTCRASTGQYLVSKYIKENTDFKVVYVGEGSDELTGGYLYFHNAPDEISFDKECKRLLKDIHFFDGKRSDRCISHFGLESRVPFLDTDFVDYYLSIDSKIRFHKINGGENKIEKYLLRKAFDKNSNKDGYEYLPKEVLWRIKEAFSDGVSSKKKSWYEVIQDYVKDEIGKEYEEMKKKYGWYLMPYNQELYFYRKIFTEYYGEDNALVLPYFWLPKWSGNITEASARVLKVYKKNL